MAGEGELDRNQLAKAVHALFQYVEKDGVKDGAMFGAGEKIVLQMFLKKVPTHNLQVIKIVLPNTLMKESSDVCLFVKDLDKKERDYAPTVEHFKDLLESNGVENVSEVIPLKRLVLEYQPYEAKRNLSNMYDFYLADERIYNRLPRLLGKDFYARKRYPIKVDLLEDNLKKEINKGLSSTQLVVGGKGSCCQVTVAHTALTEDQVVDNIQAAFDRVKKMLIDGVVNIRRVHLRTQDSPSLPIYSSQGSANDVVPKSLKRKIDDTEPEEVSTIMGKKVKVTPDGRILFYSEDGVLLDRRAAQMDDEDDLDDEEESSDEESEDEEPATPIRKGKRGNRGKPDKVLKGSKVVKPSKAESKVVKTNGAESKVAKTKKLPEGKSQKKASPEGKKSKGVPVKSPKGKKSKGVPVKAKKVAEAKKGKGVPVKSPEAKKGKGVPVKSSEGKKSKGVPVKAKTVAKAAEKSGLQKKVTSEAPSPKASKPKGMKTRPTKVAAPKVAKLKEKSMSKATGSVKSKPKVKKMKTKQ